jgi:exo-beta-1,3-glucanase (GH17 family)
MHRLVVAICLAIGPCVVSVRAQGPVQKTYGIDFSPYLNGQNPNAGTQISASQILSRLQIIAPYTNWTRSFGSTHGLENIPSIARQLGLKVAANAWISSDTAQNKLEINNLIAAANAGVVDVAIVGSEAILRNDVSVDQLIAYMNQVRQAIPSNIPVTTADIWGTFIDNPSLIGASDVVFANFYPYWEGTAVGNAVCSLQQEYQQLASAAGSKTVVISETGWPSAGNAVGAAVPSAANANLFTQQFLSWAAANGIPTFFFEAFDEAWKVPYEGPQGAHWGIWDATGVIKPGEDAFFNGQTMSPTCDGTIPGAVGIGFTYVPPYGSSTLLEVQVTGVKPSSYAVATYIKVFGGWWTKPTFAQPTATINPDGTSRINIVTGGSDAIATDIAAFLIPLNVVPPSASGGGLPVIPNAVATTQVSRTQSSISGTITDFQSNPLAGAVISDPVLGTTISAPDGNYSFYYIVAAGTATLTVSYPGKVFSTSPATFTIPAGNETVDFVGAPILAFTSLVLPDGATGAPYTATLSAAGGAPPYLWSITTGTLPPGLVLDPAFGVITGTPTSTNGSPFSFSATVTDQLGNVSSPQQFFITIVPGIPTTVVLTSSANTSTFGQLVTLKATVTPSPPEGKVTFYEGTTLLGTRPVSNGVATLVTRSLIQGSWPSTARFIGVGAYLTSISSNLQLKISARPEGSLKAATSSGPVANPNYVAVGDFNGDNKADLAFANYYPVRSLSILLGNGDGTFQPALNTPWGDNIGVWSVALGDFNGDGKTDIATVNLAGVEVLIGNGDGTFQSPVYNDVGTDPRSLTVGDFNGDGNADLAVANYFTNNVSVLLGRGDGTFLPAVNFSVDFGPLSIAAGDFNKDGKTDLVISNLGGVDVSVLLGNGDGTFETAVNYAVGGYPRSIAVGDFDNDGNTDIATANENSESVSVLLGKGDGTFLAAKEFPAGETPNTVATADVNGDGRADLVVVNFNGGNVLLGNGDGTFQPGTPFAVGSDSVSVAVGDFNGDGATDIVIANTADGSILLGIVVPRLKPPSQITSQ